MGVVLEGLPDRPIGLGEGAIGASGASDSGRASASTMNRWPSSSSPNEPLSQASHTTPPAAGEKPLSPSPSPQRAHEPSSGAKPAASSSFNRNASD